MSCRPVVFSYQNNDKGDDMIATTKTPAGKFVSHVGNYSTPAYCTEVMAQADAACWEAFHMTETPKEASDRLFHDVDATAIETPIESIERGVFVLHTFTMKAAYGRKGNLLQSARQVTRWVETSGFSWKRYEARGDSPAEWGVRLVAFNYGLYLPEGSILKVHANPEVLRAAREAARPRLFG